MSTHLMATCVPSCSSACHTCARRHFSLCEAASASVWAGQHSPGCSRHARRAPAACRLQGLWASCPGRSWPLTRRTWWIWRQCACGGATSDAPYRALLMRWHQLLSTAVGWLSSARALSGSSSGCERPLGLLYQATRLVQSKLSFCLRSCQPSLPDDSSPLLQKCAVGLLVEGLPGQLSCGSCLRPLCHCTAPCAGASVPLKQATEAAPGSSMSQPDHSEPGETL